MSKIWSRKKVKNLSKYVKSRTSRNVFRDSMWRVEPHGTNRVLVPRRCMYMYRYMYCTCTCTCTCTGMYLYIVHVPSIVETTAVCPAGLYYKQMSVRLDCTTSKIVCPAGLYYKQNCLSGWIVLQAVLVVQSSRTDSCCFDNNLYLYMYMYMYRYMLNCCRAEEYSHRCWGWRWTSFNYNQSLLISWHWNLGWNSKFSPNFSWYSDLQIMLQFVFETTRKHGFWTQ